MGGDQPFDTPKPTRLLERVIELASDSNSIILDSFAGSGTTGHAVLRVNQKDGGCRRFILVEMDEAICKNITSERVKRVALGYKREDEKGEDIPGAGSGFRFCRLGPPLFAADGGFSKNVKFNDLAHHIWFRETGEPLPKGRNGRTPLLGVHGNAAFYLLYNGVLGDKSADGGNVLTNAVLAGLPKHSGPRIVFGEGCRLGKERLKREGVVFKQIPYDVRGTDL